MITTVFMPNIIAMILLLILLVSINGIAGQSMLLDSKIFFVMVFCNFLQCVGEIIAYSIDGITMQGFYVFNLVVNCMLFIINILFAFCWVIYTDYKIYEDVERSKKHAIKLGLPVLVIVMGSIVNLFVPVFYRITPDNHYQRTNLFIIPYLATYFYLLYGSIYIYRRKQFARKYIFMPVAVFMAPILLGSIVQYFFYGYSTVWVGVAVALMAVYVNVQNEASCTDVLSGLYTRMYMYQYLESALRKKDNSQKIAGIMMDIDKFKMINDTYGHLVGDDAIRSAGKIIRNTFSNGAIAVRYGGDEFVVLIPVREAQEMEGLLQKLNQAELSFNNSEEKVYKIHFSKGHSVLNTSTDSVDTFLERMDTAMYEEKKKRSEAAAS